MELYDFNPNLIFLGFYDIIYVENMKGENKMAWENVAHMIEKDYGGYVDWDEEFFQCIECGESIYKVDWQSEDYFGGHAFTGIIYCPVCESVLYEKEEEEI